MNETKEYTWSLRDDKVAPTQAIKVPLGAPGVLYGETLFETMRGRGGAFFRLHDHWARWEKGLRALGWCAAPPVAAIDRGLQRLLGQPALTRVQDARVRWTALRWDERGTCAFYITMGPYVPPAKELYERGVRAAVGAEPVEALGFAGASLPRWTRYKTGQRLVHRQSLDAAVQQGAWDALLLNAKGHIADGTRANVHVVVDQTIYTPSNDCGALPGIAQNVVRKAARELGYGWESGPCPLARLAQGDEAFLTNALVGVLPLTQADNFPIGEGVPGPVTQALINAFAVQLKKHLYPPGDARLWRPLPPGPGV